MPSPVAPARPDPAVDAFVAVYAALVDDAERARIALAHRLDRLTRTDEWGRGIPAEHPEMQILSAQLEANAAHEAGLIAQLQRAVDRHPLGAWQRSVVGVGAKQLGRLLGCIGNPYWHGPEDRPRTVDQLRAYCGYSVVGGQAQRLRAGVQANWNGAARKRAYLIAESCIKQARSPYRPVYDAARVRYAGVIVRDEPISDGHAHLRALRAVAKELLLDLWREARARTLAGDYVLRQRARRTEPPMTHPSDRLALTEAQHNAAA